MRRCTDYALLTLDEDIGNDVGYMAVANPEDAPPSEGDRLYLGGYGDDHVNNEYVDGALPLRQLRCPPCGLGGSARTV